MVTSGNRIVGVIRVNTGIRRGLENTHTGVTLGDVASRNFTIVGEEAVASDVIERMWRKEALMAVVVHRRGRACRARAIFVASSPRNTSPIRWPTA